MRVLFLLISTSILNALLIQEIKTFRLSILKQNSVGMDQGTTPKQVVCNENPQSEEGIVEMLKCNETYKERLIYSHLKR